MFVLMSEACSNAHPRFALAYELLGMAMAAIGADGRRIAARLVAGTAAPDEGRVLRRLVARLREALRTRALYRRDHGLAFDDMDALENLAAMLRGFTPMIEGVLARQAAGRPEVDDVMVLDRVAHLTSACLALVQRLNRDRQREEDGLPPRAARRSRSPTPARDAPAPPASVERAALTPRQPPFRPGPAAPASASASAAPVRLNRAQRRRLKAVPHTRTP